VDSTDPPVGVDARLPSPVGGSGDDAPFRLLARVPPRSADEAGIPLVRGPAPDTWLRSSAPAAAPSGGIDLPTLPDPSADRDDDPEGLAPRRLLPGGRSAFDPGRAGVKALAVVAAVVVVGAALFAYQARPTVEPVAPASAPPAVAAVTGAESTSPRAIVVAVSGKVRQPGLVRLPAGARVADAVQAAGGALPGADLTPLNLARRVADGELIAVGITPPPAAIGGGSGQGPAPKVNLNTASVSELDGLPGVGPVLAQRIVDHRERTGGFRSVGELRNVDGIGAARFEELKDLVTT
jgi:competence protein ComEA